MSNILVQETWINATEHYSCGDSGIYESSYDNPGDLYRALVKVYGRCISKVYQDTPAGVITIGWVFCKRSKYDDCNKTFLQETWITLHKSKPVTSVKYDYFQLKG